MNLPDTKYTTDAAWEEWGRRDPYFGVLTRPRYRRDVITKKDKDDLFLSGRMHMSNVMDFIHRHVSPGFAPTTSLDFGCGVGRTLIPLANISREAVGLDVSPSMLKEAQANCAEQKVENVHFLLSDDLLTTLDGQFDLIHSFIVFQHIPVERGLTLFQKLLIHLAPRGIAAMHFLYSKRIYATTLGIEPPKPSPGRKSRAAFPAQADPEMQMNPYSVTQLMFIVQSLGIKDVHFEFTDHGGELGAYVVFANHS